MFVELLGKPGFATLIAAVMAALIAVAGWFAGSILTSRRDDRTKRLALTIAQSEKQISEFYAPLVFLLAQLDTIASVKEMIEREGKEQVEGLGQIAYNEFFRPIHEEIVSILKTKIHLIEGGKIPPSLLDYIAHFTSEKIAWRLDEARINTFPYVTGFPGRFPEQLRRHQEAVYNRYEEAIRELRHGVIPKQG